jgi:catechol 2,3-dioxygenase-like lactoylglutathione lyase family enzyme
VSELPLSRKIDCLALRVPELDAAVAFYAELGHELIWRSSTGAGHFVTDADGDVIGVEQS